jgi:hypothetical protein
MAMGKAKIIAALLVTTVATSSTWLLLTNREKPTPPPKEKPAAQHAKQSLETNTNPAETIFESHAQAIIRVVAIGKEIQKGTGFVAKATEPIILTNKHITQEADILLVEKDGEVWAVESWKENTEVDAAFLPAPEELVAAGLTLNLKDQTKAGEKIFTIGHPLGGPICIQEGIVSAEEGETLTYSAPTAEGSSGSPVINTKGHVIAISQASVPNAQNYNLAIKTASLAYRDRWITKTNSLSETETNALKKTLRNLTGANKSERELGKQLKEAQTENTPRAIVLRKTRRARENLSNNLRELQEAAENLDWLAIHNPNPAPHTIREINNLKTSAHHLLPTAKEWETTMWGSLQETLPAPQATRRFQESRKAAQQFEKLTLTANKTARNLRAFIKRSQLGVVTEEDKTLIRQAEQNLGLELEKTKTQYQRAQQAILNP